MRTCNVCETDKPDSKFRKFGRGLKKTCMACESGGGSVKANSAPSPVKLNGAHLELAAGLGFRASLEDGAFRIEQDRAADDGETYTHELALAPHEARQLIDWIASQVEAA
jgi:hypothetical protein